MASARDFPNPLPAGRTLWAGAAAVLTVTACTAPAATVRPPNIIVILCDDLGYTDVGCFGAQGWSTPNLDRMAKEGMRFTNFYAAQAVCSASRAGLLTGCYPNRVGISGALMPNSPRRLAPEETTIASMLKPAGYATGMVGKWHLGDTARCMPWNHGFDDYFGLPYSNDMWPLRHGENPKPDASYPPLVLYDGPRKADTVLTLADQDRLTTRYTERAFAFIRDHRAQPFFLYFAHSMPHVPLGVSGNFRGRSSQGRYGDVVMEIDGSVGAILQALRDAGIDGDTLVVFTSDNGPWLNYGNHAGTCRGLREGKGTSFEGGQKVPCIMRWPGRISAGAECRRLAATLDLLPTFAELAGAPLPKRKIDGVNLSPLLYGEPGACPRRTFLYYYNENDLEAVRRDNWKLIFPHDHRTYMGFKPGRDGKPGPCGTAHTALALYDLDADPGETADLKDKHPEIVAELERIAEDARADLGDQLRKRPGPGRRLPRAAGSVPDNH